MGVHSVVNELGVSTPMRLYQQFSIRAQWAFRNELRKRDGYGFYESLDGTGVYPRMPPGALNPMWVVLPLALPNAFQSGSFS